MNGTVELQRWKSCYGSPIGIGRVSVDLESLSLGTPSVAMNNFRWNVCNVARLEDPPPCFSVSGDDIPHPRARNQTHSAAFRVWLELEKRRWTIPIPRSLYFPHSSFLLAFFFNQTLVFHSMLIRKLARRGYLRLLYIYVKYRNSRIWWGGLRRFELFG